MYRLYVAVFSDFMHIKKVSNFIKID